ADLITERKSLKRGPQFKRGPLERREEAKREPQKTELPWDILPLLGTYYDNYEDSISYPCGVSVSAGEFCGYFVSLSFYGAYYDQDDGKYTFGYYCPTVCDPSFGAYIVFNDSAVTELTNTSFTI
ncbi:19413_t:CDS:1, partial [Gigaspora rosea]